MNNNLKEHPVGPYSPEGRETLEKLRGAVLPLVLDYLNTRPEKATKEDVLDAEASLLYDLSIKVRMSKSDLHDRDLASLCTALSLAVLGGSAAPSEIAQIEYEYAEQRRPQDSIIDEGLYQLNWYDVLSIVTDIPGTPRQSLPMPLLDRGFVRALRERMADIGGFTPTPLLSHNRAYTQDPEKHQVAANVVYRSLAQQAQKVPLREIIQTVYKPHSGDEQSNEDIERVLALADKITRLGKNPAELDTFINERISALATIYGNN